MTDVAIPKRFRLADHIKDGNLSRVLRNELAELKGEQLALAQEAIIEVSGSGAPGTFEQLVDAYKLAIARALHPERKLVKDPHVDRSVVKNPQLAAHLDRELVDVTAEDLAAVNKALRAIIAEARELVAEADKDGIRWVDHGATSVCAQAGRHPVIPVGEQHPCGYFRAPDEWRDVFRLEVRKALGR